ncbi:MAG: DUF4258 domain-containing protein [Deinococcus sp.]|nr:DUF4258 domain-containing protein [Deinococcus sp.]
MDIAWIRAQVAPGDYEYSVHAEAERQAERPRVQDVENALLNGDVLEDYPHDPRGPSCLVLGFSGRKPVHIVCGHTSLGKLRVITVYIPRTPKWSDPRTRRKA